jgi:hypothetical protein
VGDLEYAVISRDLGQECGSERTDIMLEYGDCYRQSL